MVVCVLIFPLLCNLGIEVWISSWMTHTRTYLWTFVYRLEMNDDFGC